jgi:hypothetical protein
MATTLDLPLRFWLALLTVACHSFAVAKQPVDGPVKFPTNHSAFTLRFPQGWICDPEREENMDCEPGENSGYVFSIMSLASINSAKEVTAALPKLATAMADSAKLNKFQLGDIETRDAAGIKFIGIRGVGRGAGDTEGFEFMVMVHAFEVKGKFYAIVRAGLKQTAAQQEKAFDQITASITPTM